MTEREMFEKSFERPRNYFRLNHEEQWAIDKRLGILDWKGEGLTDEDKKRFDNYFSPRCKNARCASVREAVRKAQELIGRRSTVEGDRFLDDMAEILFSIDVTEDDKVK